MLSPGKVHYEVGAYTDAMSYGGIGAVHRLVTKLGLAHRRVTVLVDRCICPIMSRTTVLNITYNVMRRHGGYRAFAK